MNNYEGLETLSVKEVAEVLGIGYNLAYKLVKTKGFPSKKIGRVYRISKLGLVNWINSNPN